MRYATSDEDSARWDGFRFRPGDLVVSTRSKHGTTWLQTILLLLIHRRVIKTHTPLDGVPADARATYLVAARHPLEAYHRRAASLAPADLLAWLHRRPR